MKNPFRTTGNKNLCLLLLFLITIFMSACILNTILDGLPFISKEDVLEQPFEEQVSEPQPSKTATTTSTAVPKNTATPTNTVTATTAAVTNPMSGLPAEDPESLDLPPAMVAISNFPVSVRPQAGLSFAPLVYEFYIGEGMTRLLAFFYGDLPDSNGAETEIGPVHTGRLPDEGLRQLYQGFLVNSGASDNVGRNLYHETSLIAETDAQIGKIMVSSQRLNSIAEAEKEELDEMSDRGMRFDAAVPPNGLPAESFWLMYSYPNQIIWRYDPASGAYLRYQDKGDATTFERLDDRLTGEALTFENVIFFFAQHEAVYASLIDIKFTFFEQETAVLLRDGQLYKIYWSTRNIAQSAAEGKSSPIRFIDHSGDLFPLKPGQTWVEIVHPGAAYWESVDSDVYFDRASKTQEGSGHWSMVYEPPGAILDTPE